MLFGQTFTVEALIVALVELSALPFIVIHYILTMEKHSEACGSIGPELALLILLYSISPTLGYLYWSCLSCQNNQSSLRVHKFCTLVTLVRKVVVSPLMIAT